MLLVFRELRSVASLGVKHANMRRRGARAGPVPFPGAGFVPVTLGNRNAKRYARSRTRPASWPARGRINKGRPD